MDAGRSRPVGSDPASSSNSRRKVQLLPYKFCAESSSDSPENNTPTTTPALSSLAPSSSSPSPPQSPDSVSPQNLSPSSSSAFVSASASPFLVSPSFNAEPEDRLPPISEHIHGKYGTLPNMGSLVPSTSFNPRPLFSSQRSNAHLLPSSSSIPTLGRPQLCDVFIGYSGNDHLLLHFCKWLQAELELQGIACFATNRGNYSEPKADDVARRIMNSARCGVVVITKCTFRSPWAMEELRVFLGRRSLVPILFDISLGDCCPNDVVMQRHAWEREGGELWRIYGGSEVEWRDTVDALLKVDELNACNGNWRDCILKSVGLLGSRLGRKSVAERGKPNKMTIEDVELPLPRNTKFIGRERELETVYNLLFYGKERRNEVPVETIVNDWSHARDDLVPRYETQVQFTAHKNRKTRHNKERKMHTQKMSPVVKEVITREREFESPCTTQSWVYVHGMPGMGKTELVLEYAYRNIQHYKMVLWIQGEARYLRQNYLTLSSLLDVDVAMSVPSGSERSLRTFREMEIEAVERVRRELSRNIPYLLVIDNLEIDRDWWDGLELVDLLPEAGSATHVIVTTRLKSLPRLQKLQLSCLEGAEIISLMKGNKVFPEQELSALGKIAEKLGNLTFALFIVSKLLELSILPSRLLQIIEKGPEDQSWTDTIYGSHPFVLAVVEHCFNLLDKPHKVNRLAINMAWSTGWLAPGPIPLNLLACIAAECGRKSAGLKLMEWCKNCQGCCYAPEYKKKDIQAGLLLVKYGLARASSQNGCIQVHDIVQLYARRKGGVSVARLVAFGICKFGFLSQHSLHWWAAAFLVFGFGNENATVKMKVSDLLPFSKRVVLPLALHAFTLFCRCHAALELIRLCGNALDEVLQSFDLQNLTGWDKMFCCKLGGRRGANEDVDEYLWQDVTLFKALLLETSAKLLMEGGQFDTGEEMCRTCISIRTVMLGKEHSDTISAQGILNKLARLRANC